MPQYEQIDELDEAVVRDHRLYGGGRPPPYYAPPPPSPPPVKTATLTTSQGTAILNLPQAVAADARVDVLEQRFNLLQTELVRVRAELALRRGDSSGQSTLFLLFTLMNQKKLREDLEGHTHDVDTTTTPPTTGKPKLPAASSSSSFSSFLPLLLFMPGIFGQASTGSTQDAMSPLMMLVLADAF
jgi:hypothetical protein